jgi:outer membrane lipoprotein-sorting protein
MDDKRLKITLLFIVLTWWLAAGLAQAAEFSAVIINRMESRETQGKIYMKGEKMRREFAAGEQVGITIVRPDKKVMWMLMPGQKSVMEMPFSKASLEKMMGMSQEQQAEMKLLGPEKVNGYETEKYETTVKGSVKPMKHYVWVSKKLGVPIKMVSLDGKFSMNYRDIKEGGVPDSLFEIPPGYQKMTMPPGMPGGPGMPPQGPPPGRQ